MVVVQTGGVNVRGYPVAISLVLVDVSLQVIVGWDVSSEMPCHEEGLVLDHHAPKRGCFAG